MNINNQLYGFNKFHEVDNLTKIGTGTGADVFSLKQAIKEAKAGDTDPSLLPAFRFRDTLASSARTKEFLEYKLFLPPDKNAVVGKANYRDTGIDGLNVVLKPLADLNEASDFMVYVGAKRAMDIYNHLAKQKVPLKKINLPFTKEQAKKIIDYGELDPKIYKQKYNEDSFKTGGDYRFYLNDLKKFIHSYKNPEDEVTIAMCGKYTELIDSYKSVMEAFVHAGVENKAKVNIKWVHTEKIKNDKTAAKAFKNVDGILLLPGFGSRGGEGKILSSKYSRENYIPFLGICLGLQCAVIDYARYVCGMRDANSTEFNKETKYPVIDLMESQRAIKIKGGTMRLGAYDCAIKSGTKTFLAYRKKNISERHRHRYEVNNRYRNRLEKNGLVFSGTNKKLGVVETIEISDHPWFIASQFHPELKSRVNKAHPLFRDFIKAAIKEQR